MLSCYLIDMYTIDYYAKTAMCYTRVRSQNVSFILQQATNDGLYMKLPLNIAVIVRAMVKSLTEIL